MICIIPMAGIGSRFVNAGYTIPKPFLPIKGKPLIEYVVDNITTKDDKVFLLANIKHLEYFDSTNLLDNHNIAIIPVLHRTEGALCTVLLAEKFLATDEPILIANSDQIVEYNRESWLETCNSNTGTIMTFDSINPACSYAKVDENNKVIQVAEKEVISNLATVGVYHFHSGHQFLESAKFMVDNNIKHKGEFYVAPVYNLYIKDNPNVTIFKVDRMLGFGIPQDFENNYNEIG